MAAERNCFQSTAPRTPYHLVGGAAPLCHQLHPIFGNADRMRWLGFDLVVLFNDSFLHGLHVFSFLDYSFRDKPGAAGGPRKLPGQPRLAIGCAVFLGLDLRRDADCLLSHLPAPISLPGNNGL